MRYAVLSDIHGNLDALAAVLADVESVGVDALCSLGDIIGYGPEPGACLALVRSRAAVSLLGNHDAAVAGTTPLEEFNEFARSAVEWTAGQLSSGEVDYLRSLPYLQRLPDVRLAHASPVEPERWHYIHGLSDLHEGFAAFAEPLCFVGHSHRPGIYAIAGDGSVRRCGARETRRTAVRYLVNAGSVGQPRDRDPRSSWALCDAGSGLLEVRRVAYPVERTQEKMRAAGLPTFLIDRLGSGA